MFEDGLSIRNVMKGTCFPEAEKKIKDGK